MTSRHWNYRVTRERLDDGSYLFALREVYYEDDRPVAWSAEPDSFVGESAEEVTDSLSKALVSALGRDVLDIDTTEAD